MKHWTNTLSPRKRDALLDSKIREHYGHGRGNRKVRISRGGGDVEYYGSTEPTDRSQDFWHFGGTRDSLAHELYAQLQDACGLPVCAAPAAEGR